MGDAQHDAPGMVRRVEEGRQLRDAARTIVKVLPALNVQAEQCAQCGRRHDANFTEAETYRRLTRIVSELKRFAYVLESGIDIITEKKRLRKEEGK